MIQIYGFVIYIVPLAYGTTSSSAGGSGSGGATNGQVQLGSQAISSMDSDIPQAIAQSQNTASGTSISLYGSSNSNLNLDPVDAVTYATYNGNNYASSNGNAITGILQNNDQTHSNTTGQQHFSIGQSHTTGNGTGVSVGNSGSASLSRVEYTTRSPYMTVTTCYISYCGDNCFVTSYCSCACRTPYPYYTTYPYPSPSPVTAIPFVETEVRQRKVAQHVDNRQRKPAQQAESKQRKTAALERTRGKTEERKVPVQSKSHEKPQGKLVQRNGALGKPVAQRA